MKSLRESLINEYYSNEGKAYQAINNLFDDIRSYTYYFPERYRELKHDVDYFSVPCNISLNDIIRPILGGRIGKDCRITAVIADHGIMCLQFQNSKNIFPLTFISDEVLQNLYELLNKEWKSFLGRVSADEYQEKMERERM